ncbi:MAG TPA: aminotransferase class III-fold pyridoxal phosphate-dependent enzyme [Candidatus Limnocylindria bacterium]|nr:aminotransferase class III-fold pyridoxal phosphate-dependent enzyme [Candidatus Limnocylindria bacterium]
MKTAGVLHAAPPRIGPADARRIARATFDVDGDVAELVSERDRNFLLRSDGEGWVLKISNPAEDPSVVDMEVAAVDHVLGIDPALPLAHAIPARSGATVERAAVDGVEHLVRLLPWLPGQHRAPGDLDATNVRQVGKVVGRLALALRSFFHPAAGRAIEWDQKHLLDLAPHAGLVANPARRVLLERALERFAQRVAPALPRLRSQAIHNDVTLDNLLFDAAGSVSGLIDFGDMAHTALVLDIPATLQSLVREREDIFEVAAAFLPGYTSVVALERDEADLLADLLAGRMAQTILISEWRTRQFPDNAYITGWAEPAWTLLGQLERAGFDESARRLSALARAPVTRAGGPAPDDELIARRRVLGNALEPLTYRRPLHLVSGSGAWMHDAQGRAYLDAYNNVPVVGHANPRVADAIARQAALLNTNTRYLHTAVVELAERIAAGMPEGLDTVMFVNSGSEANDLAWRLATTATGGEAGLVTEWAYHGVSAAIADFSPSEWSRGQRPHGVETFPAPDTFGGPFAGADAARGAMRDALDRLAGRRHRPAAVFVDAMFTSDGIFAPDASVVAALIDEARSAGALYVADEVQAGHGRGGDGLWAFTAWGLTPDIVTLGKPMGNGHPVAAVVTRGEVADRLAANTTFFSTFGGNPVACVAALSVLDVIEEEGLVQHAAVLGGDLRRELTGLRARHPEIADVRGRGLMTGVELVDPASGSPATELAARVRDDMRERGVLIGTTRREKNVLKIRPPLVIAADEARLITETLDRVLSAY